MADPVQPAGSVAVQVPPPPPAKKEEKKPEAPKNAPVPVEEVKVPTVDLKTPRLELAILGYVPLADFGNDKLTNVDPHKGFMQDFRLFWPRFNILSDGKLWFSPSLNVTHNKLETGQLNQKGDPITSSADLWTIGVGADLFYDPIRYFGVFAGLKFGATHAGSKAPEDGESGNDGTFVANNALKVSLDNWGATYGFRAGVRFPEQKVADWLGIGAMAYYQLDHTNYSVTPDWSDRNPNDPAISVPSTRHAFLLGVSGTFGEVAKYYPKSKEEDKKPPVPAAPKVEKKEPPAAPPVPKAVADIQAMVQPMKDEVNKVLGQKLAESTAVSLKTAKDSDKSVAERRDAAELTVRTSKEATEGYKKSLEKLTNAEKALVEVKKDTKLKPEEIKLAEEAVASMRAEADKLKTEAHQAWENASNAVKAFNEIKKLPKDVKKLDPFKDVDPATLAPAAPKP